MSQLNPNSPSTPTSSAHSTHWQPTISSIPPPRELPGSQVYRLPTQATFDSPSPFYVIRVGAVMGIFLDWKSIQWAVKAAAILPLGPQWQKFSDWNQAVHFASTGEIRDPVILAGPPSNAPPICLQPEHIMADIFLPGTILLAQPGSIVCPYTGALGPPPAVQIVVSRFSEVNSVWSSPPLNCIPLRNDNADVIEALSPWNQTYDPIEPLLPPSRISSPVPTLVSTTAADYDVFMAPSLSSSSSASVPETSGAARVARWAAGPIRSLADSTPTSRHSESSGRSRRNIRSQPATPTTRLCLLNTDSSPMLTPIPPSVIPSEVQRRLQVLHALRREQPSHCRKRAHVPWVGESPNEGG